MSIYDSIGGEPAVRAAVDDFYARLLADRQLAAFFTGTDLRRENTIGQIGEALTPLRGAIVTVPPADLGG